MIESHIEHFLLEQIPTFVKSASDVAVLNGDHNVAHAKLLLAQYKYTRVPVLDKEKNYLGTLGLTDIADFELSQDFFYEKSEKTPITQIVNTNMATVQVGVKLEEIMHLLVKEPFLPVLNGHRFVGIIVRQEILKAFNALAHDFTKEYDIIKRD